MRRIVACVAVGGLLACPVVVGSATAALAASCPDNNWTKNGTVHGKFTANGVNIRTGPSPSCTSVGQGQKTHNVEIDCYRRGSDGYNWMRIKDTTNSKAGWVRNDYLTNYSPFPC